MNRACAPSSPSLERECFLKHLSLFWHGLHVVAEFFYYLIRETKVSTCVILPRHEESFALGDKESMGNTHFAPGWHLWVLGLSLRLLSLLSSQSGGPTRLCSRSTCRPTHTRDRALLHNYPRKFRNCTRTHSAPCTV